MLELLKLFDVLHLKNAKTYIQSGNVVFQAKKADEQSLQKNIEKEISKKFGFEVPVLIKPATDITTILKSNPFLKQNDIDQSKLHVTFIDGFINKKIIDCLSEQTFGSDEFTVGKNVIYLHCPNGYGNTKLSNTFWENTFFISCILSFK